MKHERHKRPRPPLDREALDRVAIHYVGRYATTAAKLRTYLVRKLRERGWQGDAEPALDDLVERLRRLGFIDDKAFAVAKAESLGRRGFGGRRVADALRVAGVTEEDSHEAKTTASEGAWSTALRFAERKRIGPFAEKEPDRALRKKHFAAMMRAGHAADIVRRLVSARPGVVPECEDR